MHQYIKDANQMIRDIKNKEHLKKRSFGRMHFHSSNFRFGRMHLHGSNVRLPAWYTRVQKGVPNKALYRLMRRGGTASYRKTCYIMARAMLMEFLENTVEAAAELADYSRRKTIMLRDVEKALKMKYGMRVYA